MIVCKNYENFRPGQKVKSLVNRPPLIQVGTTGIILNRWMGTLYAVRMPNGDLYRWLDDYDLSPVDTSNHNLRVGDLAILKMDAHRHFHFHHPQLENGFVVTIVKIVETDFYDLEIDGKGSLGWFTGFEITTFF